jgi:hypothetical protein
MAAKPRIVFARSTCAVRAPGSKYPTSVHVNEPWYADHPLVLSHPDLFGDAPSLVFPRGWTPPEAPVEQASAAPGEKRATRRAD